MSHQGGESTYTPDPDFNGTDQFVVSVSREDSAATATVTITVVPVIDAPIGVDDSFAGARNTASVLAQAALLANDTDVDGDPLTVTAVSGATNGAVAITGTDVTFTPTTGFTGDATRRDVHVHAERWHHHRHGGYSHRAMPLTRPALDPATVPPRTTSGYPEPFASRVLPREKRALGDALGLTKIGINLTTLPPGKESAMRHHHTFEDELVFVVEGEVVLVTDEGEQVLTAGMCAGFPAGVANGHQLVNRSDRPARYLEVSNRDPRDGASYPDVDLVYEKISEGARYTHKDGTPY